MTDCVGIGMDGASVMCGHYNSLYSRMREVNPILVLVKCVCHSLQLACNEAVDILPSQIDYLVRETFNWYQLNVFGEWESVLPFPKEATPLLGHLWGH